MAHWSARYVGRPYVPHQDDCAKLAADVQREVFGREVALPAERPAGAREAAQLIAQIERDHGCRIDAPVEGCVVLMRRGQAVRPWHVGVYFAQGGEGWVLHATQSSGQAITTRIRQLPMMGLQIEGFYEWQ